MTESKMMSLMDLVARPAPKPWAEGDKIPWNDPAFSERMLREHLSQDHDAASRRAVTIDKQVAWIHKDLLKGKGTLILDLGCGPGFYTNRLAGLGHTCTGIDFSPASIAYARQTAGPACQYVQGDLREVDFGRGYGLAMLIFGEFNTFHPAQAKVILQKAWAALAEDGLLVLEAHTFEAIQRIGERGRTWYSSTSGLWSARPHLCLNECSWDEASEVATNRYLVVDAETGEVSAYGDSMQAYSPDGYEALLTETGYGEVSFFPALTGAEADRNEDLVVIVGRKASEGN